MPKPNDTEMLDWLDRNDNGTKQAALYLGGPWRWISHENPACGYWKFEGFPELGRHNTVRDAIRAAMKKETSTK